MLIQLLEFEPKRHLNGALIAPGVHLTEGGVVGGVDAESWPQADEAGRAGRTGTLNTGETPDFRMIEDVEDLEPVHHLQSLSDVEVLDQTAVQVLDPGQPEGVAACGAIGAICRLLESSGVDPLRELFWPA